MSLRESEISRARRAKHSHQKQIKRKQRLAELPAMLNDAQVLTPREWAVLNAISPRTAQRILHAPGGPAIVQLSPRRIGITVAADKLWKASRERR